MGREAVTPGRLDSDSGGVRAAQDYPAAAPAPSARARQPAGGRAGGWARAAGQAGGRASPARSQLVGERGTVGGRADPGAGGLTGWRAGGSAAAPGHTRPPVQPPARRPVRPPVPGSARPPTVPRAPTS